MTERDELFARIDILAREIIELNAAREDLICGLAIASGRKVAFGPAPQPNREASGLSWANEPPRHEVDLSPTFSILATPGQHTITKSRCAIEDMEDAVGAIDFRRLEELLGKEKLVRLIMAVGLMRALIGEVNKIGYPANSVVPTAFAVFVSDRLRRRGAGTSRGPDEGSCAPRCRPGKLLALSRKRAHRLRDCYSFHFLRRRSEARSHRLICPPSAVARHARSSQGLRLGKDQTPPVSRRALGQEKAFHSFRTQKPRSRQKTGFIIRPSRWVAQAPAPAKVFSDRAHERVQPRFTGQTRVVRNPGRPARRSLIRIEAVEKSGQAKTERPSVGLNVLQDLYQRSRSGREGRMSLHRRLSGNRVSPQCVDWAP